MITYAKIPFSPFYLPTHKCRILERWTLLKGNKTEESPFPEFWEISFFLKVVGVYVVVTRLNSGTSTDYVSPLCAQNCCQMGAIPKVQFSLRLLGGPCVPQCWWPVSSSSYTPSRRAAFFLSWNSKNRQFQEIFHLEDRKRQVRGRSLGLTLKNCVLK
jgi:hypothetical protein